MEFVASCAMGLEALLADELRLLTEAPLRPLTGMVSWKGSLSGALRACLWSRLASRITVILTRASIRDADGLFELLHSIAWEDHISPGTTIAVDAHGTNGSLRSTRFIAQRSKDAIVDALRTRKGFRPAVDLDQPDLRIVVRIGRKTTSVGIDLGAGPLFKRNESVARYTRAAFPQLRSDYAAMLLHSVGWHHPTTRESNDVLCLFSGYGSLVVEAAGIALDHAPGLLRKRWGHTKWRGADPQVWQYLLDEAHARAASEAVAVPQILTCEPRRGSESIASYSLRAMGLDIATTNLSPDDVSNLSRPTRAVCDLSWISSNELAWEAFALSMLKRLTLAIDELNDATDDPMDLTTETTSPLDEIHADPRCLIAPANSRLALISQISIPSSVTDDNPTTTIATMIGSKAATIQSFSCQHTASKRIVPIKDASVPILVDTSDQFVARLAKNIRIRSRWASRTDVSCYRLYDADLPDYNLSIDLFGSALSSNRYLQICEYAAPKGIDVERAHMRLLDAISIAMRSLDVRPENVHVKVRSRSRGGSQYAQEATTLLREMTGSQDNQQGSSSHTKTNKTLSKSLPYGSHLIYEGGLTFEVNFSARHDCGLFLDHRDTRAWLRELVKPYGKDSRFLNLFCYTGSATVYVTDGGCQHTTSVDMSAPSLDWARRNMQHNGFDTGDHQFIKADVLRWTREERHSSKRYDLIFCDVPTFSNSKSMGHRSFDVQRDHADLLITVSRLLTSKREGRDAGICIFSCNLRNFRPDIATLTRAGVAIEDVTARTIPEDFIRTPQVHHCYRITRMR